MRRTVTTDFLLVCDRSYLIPAITSSYMAGVIFQRNLINKYGNSSFYVGFLGRNIQLHVRVSLRPLRAAEDPLVHGTGMA